MVRSKSGLPEGTDIAAWVVNPTCPKCHGPMYDNRAKKESGKYTAQRADFSCKDKDGCDKGVWLTAEDKAALSSTVVQRSSGAVAGSPGRPVLSPEARKAGRDKVISDYFGLMKIAAERMAIIAKQHAASLDMGNVQAATYSVYGLMEKHGYLSAPSRTAAPAAAPAPMPQPAAPQPLPVRRTPAPPPPQEEEDPYADERELPF